MSPRQSSPASAKKQQKTPFYQKLNNNKNEVGMYVRVNFISSTWKVPRLNSIDVNNWDNSVYGYGYGISLAF